MTDASMVPNANLQDRNRRHNERGSRFTGCDSIAEVLRLARCGWPEGVAEAKNLSDKLESRMTSYIERTDVYYDVTGEILDVGRYCAGDPEHWGNWKSTIVEGVGNKFIHAVYNNTASAGVDKEVLMRRGATMAAFIHLMELGGYRVKTTIVIPTGYAKTADGVFAMVKCCVKNFDEHLDQDKLTFALAHAATLRTLGFMTYDTIKNPILYRKLGIGDNYGRVTDIPKEERGDLYLGSMAYGQADWECEDSAGQWLARQLKEYGVLSADYVV